jgi:chemotaxis protein methyltransferase CheR
MQDDDFDYIRTLVRNNSGLILEPGKQYLVESRLNPVAREHGFPSIPHLIHCLRCEPPSDLHRRVVEAMTTNETSFFREVRVFEMFRKAIVPRLLAARSSERSLNLWCAASSTGQEPYSFAILLREHFPILESWDVTFMASDFSTQLLARARAGCYNQLEVNRGLPAHLLVKYFKKQGTVWEISADIRHMIKFREINLIHRWPYIPRMDVIFLRNVLIYLDRATKKDILSRIRLLLNPDGYVLVGGTETIADLDDGFEPVALEGATCFRLRKKNGPCDTSGRSEIASELSLTLLAHRRTHEGNG